MIEAIAFELSMCQLTEMETKHPLAIWRKSQTPALSQDDLGPLIGVSRWMVNAIETGRRQPSRNLIAAISKATDGKVSFDQFVSEKDRAA